MKKPHLVGITRVRAEWCGSGNQQPLDNLVDGDKCPKALASPDGLTIAGNICAGTTSQEPRRVNLRRRGPWA